MLNMTSEQIYSNKSRKRKFKSEPLNDHEKKFVVAQSAQSHLEFQPAEERSGKVKNKNASQEKVRPGNTSNHRRKKQAIVKLFSDELDLNTTKIASAKKDAGKAQCETMTKSVKLASRTVSPAPNETQSGTPSSGQRPGTVNKQVMENNIPIASNKAKKKRKKKKNLTLPCPKPEAFKSMLVEMGTKKISTSQKKILTPLSQPLNSPSLSQPVDQDVQDQLTKPKPKRKKKQCSEEKIVKNEHMAPENSGTLSSKEHALEYLTTWQRNRTSWRFKKVRQVWLLQHMYEKNGIPDDMFAVFLQYLQSGGGALKAKTIAEAEKIFNSCEPQLQPTDENYFQSRRSRQVIQDLHE